MSLVNSGLGLVSNLANREWTRIFNYHYAGFDGNTLVSAIVLAKLMPKTPSDAGLPDFYANLRLVDVDHNVLLGSGVCNTLTPTATTIALSGVGPLAANLELHYQKGPEGVYVEVSSMAFVYQSA